MNLTHLGDQNTKYDFSAPDKDLLETFENVSGDLVVPFLCHEFTSICPVTGQPDFAKFEIVYIPDQKCIESKSLKLYLFSFRNHGAFHESVTDQIMRDIVEKIQPKFIRVFGDFNVRGGIAIKPLAIKFRDNMTLDEKQDLSLRIENYDRLRKFDY